MLSSLDDALEEPIWMNYRVKYVIDNRKQMINFKRETKKFEETHEMLNFIHAEHGKKNILVHDRDILFSDDSNMFKEIKYSFPRHFFTLYYQPSPELHSFLTLLQHLMDKIKELRNKLISSHVC